LYRYVRNPMYIAVVALIVGQGLIFANLRVLEYGALIWLAFDLFVVLTLHKSFGPEYETFCRNVSRWRPRLHPWPN
jgi:protein-S-isoprenylcysteine O-methyltransferase Ste14